MATVRTMTRKSPEQIAAERKPIATVVREVVFARQRKLFDGLPLVEKSQSELIEEALKINKSFRI